jgi:hypothetical protein
MRVMIRIRTGTVVEVLARRAEAWDLVVEVDGSPAPAVAYPALTGPVEAGDRVVLNTTAVWLGLGTGGSHFVMAVEGRDGEAEPDARVVKLRYTPSQVTVRTVDEVHPDLPGSLDAVPVVWVPLHSMLGPAAAGAVAAGARSVAWVMTDGAALPAGLSRLSSELRDAGLVSSVISTGQAFGGDLEAVTVFSGLLAARHAAGADVVVVGDGPGNTGTHSDWGTTAVASALSLHAAQILGGRPVAALRISFADPRERHRGVSHHSITALSRVAPAQTHVAVPSLEDDEQRRRVWDDLRRAGLHERHHLIEATGQPALDLLRERGVEVRSMGRGAEQDPAFFLAAGAAGVLAGRMAARDRAWRAEASP